MNSYIMCMNMAQYWKGNFLYIRYRTIFIKEVKIYRDFPCTEKKTWLISVFAKQRKFLYMFIRKAISYLDCLFVLQKKSNYMKSNYSSNCNWLAFRLFIYHIPRIINRAGVLLFTYAKLQVPWLMHFKINVRLKTLEIIFKCHDLLYGSRTIKSNEERRPTI